MLEKNDEFFQKMGVPKTELSFQQALQQLMAFRNEWKLHRRKCDFSGEEILSAYSDDAPFPVYKNEVWWGDGWNPLPRECPQVRHRKRLARKNPFEIFYRKCAQCGKEIPSTFSPNRPETVHCEEDYLQTVL